MKLLYLGIRNIIGRHIDGTGLTHDPWRTRHRHLRMEPRPQRPGRPLRRPAPPLTKTTHSNQQSGKDVTRTYTEDLTSSNEIRRLHAIFSRPEHPAVHHLRWSTWRRRHQARARHCHYQRRQPRGPSPAGWFRPSGRPAPLPPR
jgi:hypothetical protein